MNESAVIDVLRVTSAVLTLAHSADGRARYIQNMVQDIAEITVKHPDWIPLQPRRESDDFQIQTDHYRLREAINGLASMIESWHEDTDKACKLIDTLLLGWKKEPKS